MCMFSGRVKEVSSTHIFAREGEGKSQYIVYAMHVVAHQKLAMILPVPTDQAMGEKALRFINLQAYPEFFNALDLGFLHDPTTSAAGVRAVPKAKTIKVEKVGAFDASFVPTLADFKRLDPVYRLSGEVWKRLPQYKHFGFAVFKLREGESKYHPMAFAFERARASELFFPTVHVHDGFVHKEADFDHNLFCQPGGRTPDVSGWTESSGPAARFVSVDKTSGIVDGEKHVYWKTMRGKHSNRDQILHCA